MADYTSLQNPEPRNKLESLSKILPELQAMFKANKPQIKKVAIPLEIQAEQLPYKYKTDVKQGT